MGTFDEKNRGWKSHATVPLKVNCLGISIATLSIINAFKNSADNVQGIGT